MAKPQNQPKQYSVADTAAKLNADRKNAMEESAFRASQTQSQHVSPSATPSKTNIAASGNPGLSEAVRSQWNVPQEDKPAASKATMQDVKGIGQSLKSQGVTTNESLSQQSHSKIENSFDNSAQNGSTAKATDRVKIEAKEAAKNNNNKSQSPSKEWERR